MATTLDGLTTYYANIMRVGAAAMPATDQTLLTSLASQIDGGLLSLGAAQRQVDKLAANTTSVALLAYNFFTGATPTLAGLDYLVSPAGGNTANLNAAYYQSFSLENRYINFAVNLGKLGEGQARFATDYGALTLAQSVSRAYTEIFGAAPDQAKIDAILNTQVANGLGGTYTRADYFASYGRDGLNGIGTKAAMVGWLMTEAVKADTGPYALANDAFLQDLGPDGAAVFHTNLVSTYAPKPVDSQSFNFDSGQSLTAPASLLPFQVTGKDLSVTQSIVTGLGGDTVSATGVVGGLIDTGPGNDVVTVGTLAFHVALPGAPDTGTIRLGPGDDRLTVSDRLAAGSVVDGGDGDDTLIARISELAFSPPPSTIKNIEHLVVAGIDLPIQAALTLLGTGSAYKDITLRGSGSLSLADLPQDTTLRLENFTSGNLSAVYSLKQIPVPIFPFVAYVQPDHIDLYLNNVSVAPGASVNFTTNVGNVRIHVESDSVLTSLQRATVISGPGRLTTELNGTFDASQSGGVDITRNAGISGNTILSAFDDKIALDLRESLPGTLTLGAGADIVSLHRDGRFGNMSTFGTLSGLKVTDFAKGIDHLVLDSVAPSLTTLTQFVGAATTLAQAVANVSAQLAANATGLFEYGGDTFIYRQDATGGANTGDGLIQLVGVTGLSVGTGAAVADIHYG